MPLSKYLFQSSVAHNGGNGGIELIVAGVHALQCVAHALYSACRRHSRRLVLDVETVDKMQSGQGARFGDGNCCCIDVCNDAGVCFRAVVHRGTGRRRSQHGIVLERFARPYTIRFMLLRFVVIRRIRQLLHASSAAPQHAPQSRARQCRQDTQYPIVRHYAKIKVWRRWRRVVLLCVSNAGAWCIGGAAGRTTRARLVGKQRVPVSRAPAPGNRWCATSAAARACRATSGTLL